MTIIARPPRWGPVLVVVIVLYLAVQFAVQLRHPHAPAPAADGLTAADTAGTDSAAAERLVARALAQPGPVDSVALKTGWRDDVRGVDLAAFTPKQRQLFVRYANAEPCTCGCGFTLAACRAYDLTCPVSLPRVESLRDSVLAGLITRADGLRRRPGDAVPAAPGAAARGVDGGGGAH